ncbi:MAG: peptidoglycan recognition family protein [Anaerolineae bacterium]
MARIRLGLHRMSSSADQRLRDYVAAVRPNVIKILDPGSEAEGLAVFCRSHGTDVIGRVYFDPQELGAEGGRQIEKVLNAARSCPSIRYWELHNEAWQSGDQLSRYSELSIDFMNRLEALGSGQKAVIGCFSTGQPEVGEWIRFAPALERAARSGHVLGIHCYGAPLMWYGVNDYQYNDGNAHLGPAPVPSRANLGWWNLRYRRALQELDRLRVPRPQILVTESGIDDIHPRPGPHEGKKGFRDYIDVDWTQKFGDYAAQLTWYCREVSLDPEVIGVVDFGWAAEDKQWSSFDLSLEPAMLDRVQGAMAALLDVPTVVPDPIVVPQPIVQPPLEPEEQMVRPAIEVRRGEGWTSVARRALGVEPSLTDVDALRAANPGNAGLDIGERVWLPANWYVANRVLARALRATAPAAAPAARALRSARAAAPAGALESQLASAFGAAFSDLRTSLPSNPNGPSGDFLPRALNRIDTIAVHHAAGPKDQTWEAIARFHIGPDRGWAGIGYHFGIRHGTLSYLGDIHQARACVRDLNPGVICIVMTGDYTSETVDKADADVLHRSIGLLQTWAQATLGRTLAIKGHGELPGQQTACPGGNLLALVRAMRTGVSTGAVPVIDGPALMAKAEARLTLPLNPAAGLQRAIVGDGFVPTSPEFEDQGLVAQRAEHPLTGEVRVYYVSQNRPGAPAWVDHSSPTVTAARAARARSVSRPLPVPPDDPFRFEDDAPATIPIPAPGEGAVTAATKRKSATGKASKAKATADAAPRPHRGQGR